MSEQTLRVYKSRSGQWSGQLIEDGEEVGRIAGCGSTEEVIDAAFDQGWQGFKVIDQSDDEPPPWLQAKLGLGAN